MQIESLSREDPLEKEMATNSSVLAWEIPWTEEPGRLQSLGSQSQTLLSTHAHAHIMVYHRVLNIDLCAMR